MHEHKHITRAMWQPEIIVSALLGLFSLLSGSNEGNVCYLLLSLFFPQVEHSLLLAKIRDRSAIREDMQASVTHAATFGDLKPF